jgi:hypothetical protein
VHRSAEPALQLHNQPADRYWRFQWIELSAFLGLTMLLTGAGFWRIRTYAG